MSESRSTPALPRRTGDAWLWPTATPRLRRSYDAPVERWSPGHRGVDLGAASPIVIAPAPGRVAFVGVVAGRGVLSIDHANGLRTTYEPVRALAAVGDPVTTGQPVARLTTGSGHCGDGACLHWGLRRGRDYLDPLVMLARRSPVLLPLR